MRGLSPVVASGGHSSSRCAGLSLSRPLLLRSTGSRRAGSVVVAHGPSCSAACGILPDQGSNPCPLHWQADSQPLRHQGSPEIFSLVFEATCSSSVLCKHLKMLTRTSLKNSFIHLSADSDVRLVHKDQGNSSSDDCADTLPRGRIASPRARPRAADSSPRAFPSLALFTQAIPTLHGDL